MKIHRILGPPSSELANALAEFEAPFTYPLGPGKSFRISHGQDYTLFFRAQGNGCCFIAERESRVVGALGTAGRTLWLPDGSERNAAYLGDLKIALGARGGAVLARLARAADAWLRPRVSAAFCVVMGGTPLSPEAYTGRAGIPDFRKLGDVSVLRITGNTSLARDPAHLQTTPEAVRAHYRRLSLGRYACCPGDEAKQRSRITPIWLLNAHGSACGMVEDTRQAKRLVTSEGAELLSAHLSCFAYSSVLAGADLIRAALRQAVALGFPALFVAVAGQDARTFHATLHDVEVLTAPATIYGAGLGPGAWNINSAEI